MERRLRTIKKEFVNYYQIFSNLLKTLSFE